MGPLVAYGDKKINRFISTKLQRARTTIAQIKQKQTKNLNIHDDINTFFKQLRPDTKFKHYTHQQKPLNLPLTANTALNGPQKAKHRPVPPTKRATDGQKIAKNRRNPPFFNANILFRKKIIRKYGHLRMIFYPHNKQDT